MANKLHNHSRYGLPLVRVTHGKTLHVPASRQGALTWCGRLELIACTAVTPSEEDGNLAMGVREQFSHKSWAADPSLGIFHSNLWRPISYFRATAARFWVGLYHTNCSHAPLDCAALKQFQEEVVAAPFLSINLIHAGSPLTAAPLQCRGFSATPPYTWSTGAEAGAKCGRCC